MKFKMWKVEKRGQKEKKLTLMNIVREAEKKHRAKRKIKNKIAKESRKRNRS